MNRVLQTVSAECRQYLEDKMSTKSIASGEVLFETLAPIHNMIFLSDGLVSMQTTNRDGRTVENYSVGADGVIGGYYLLGLAHHPCTARAVISGRGGWLPVSEVMVAVERFPGLQPAIAAVLGGAFRLLVQNVVCASCHSATQRIASWLLNAHDRIGGDSWDLTQRTLAEIFGLRAATVSDSCNFLMSIGAIHYSRGRFRIVDRSRLSAQSCECYEALHPIRR